MKRRRISSGLFKVSAIVVLSILSVYLIAHNPFPAREPLTSIASDTLPEEINQPSSTAQPQPTPEPLPIHSGRQIKVPILMYHYIGENPNPDDLARDSLSVSPSVFDEQMNYLKSHGYTPITLDTMMAGLYGQISLPPNPVIITFDDGYIDLYVNAFPILKKYNFSAVAFIPTGLIGTSYYLSWDQILEMHQSSLISFQAHGVSHANLASLPIDQLKFELSQSKRSLQDKLGAPVNFIAYPYGISNHDVQASSKEAGYLGGVGTWYSNIVSEGVLYNIPRIRVGGQMSIPTFALRL